MTAERDSPGRPAVFLDRDGTLVREVDFLRRPDEVELIPGVAAALRQLAAAGFARVVVTNQSGVARGYIDEARLGEIHARLHELLAREGASLDLVLYCPHLPGEAGDEAREGPSASAYRRDCSCRKPRPGMLQEAIARLGLAARGSWTVGDSARDLEAGAALGIPGILVATGKGTGEYERLSAAGAAPELFVADLPQAVELLLSHSR